MAGTLLFLPRRFLPKYIGRIFHDFRRSAAHETWKAGSSIEDCMKVTGQDQQQQINQAVQHHGCTSGSEGQHCD